MKCTILHESRGRMRVHVHAVRMTLHRADVLEAYLNHQDSIHHATVYERTGDVVLTYTGSRKEAIALLAGYKFDHAELDVLVTSNDSRKINREYQDKMFTLVAGHYARKLFLPDFLWRMASSWCALVVAALLRKSIVACSRSCCCQGTMLFCKKLRAFKNASKTAFESSSHTLYKLKGVFLNGAYENSENFHFFKQPPIPITF